MTPETSTQIIKAAGGDTEFGRLIGISNDRYFNQRINNWKRRGIPARVVLEHQDKIKKLTTKIAREAVRA